MTTFKMMILPHFENMAIKDITVPHCQKVLNEWYRIYSETKKGVYMRLLSLSMLLV